MASLIDQLRNRLRPGYSFATAEGGGFHVLDPDGVVVRTPGGQPIRITNKAEISKHHRRRVVANLSEAGVLLVERRSHSPAEPNRVKPMPRDSSPVATARTILSDPRATPRERKVARAYLRLLENHNAIRRLAMQLGAEVLKLRAILDR